MASITRSVLLRQTAPVFTRSTATRALSRPTTQQGILHSVRATAFHTTCKRAILPPLPQKIQGGVNEPTPVPSPSPSHGSYHWTFERIVAAGLIPITIAPFAAGSLHPTMDAILCAMLLIHSHMGFQSIIIDYIPTGRLPKTRKAFWWGLNAATAMVGLALYEFETTDVGLTEAIRRIWTA